MKTMHLLLMAALAGLCATASAQWQWIDKDGRKVYSDRAPPTEIPDKNVLKRPGNRPPPPPPAAADAAETGEAAAAAPGSGTGAAGAGAVAAPQPQQAPSKPTGGQDKELEAKKKQAEAAEAAKRKAADEEVMKARIENCARAKQARTTYESNTRLSHTNADGQRVVMDDATRAEELKRILGIIAKDCR